MPPPWNDWVTATTEEGNTRAIVIEGPLRVVVSVLFLRKTRDLRRIMLAFPDRRAPPYRIEGPQIAALGMELAAMERSALAGTAASAGGWGV